jgi:hypothetical protein
MTTIPITTFCAPCFGVLCPYRRTCDHYAAVERTQPGDVGRMATCRSPDGTAPLFQPKSVQQPQAVPA